MAWQDGLQVWCKFEESSGAKVTENLAQPARSGTVNGSPTFQSASYGREIVFSNNVADSVTFPSDLVTNLTAFTISMWFKPNSWISNARLFDWGDSGPTGGFAFVQGGGTNGLQFVMRNGAAATATLLFGLLNNGQRYHVMVTFDGTVTNVYLNNVLAATDPSGSMSLPSQVLTLGKRSASAINPLDGSVSDLRMWNRAITAQERNEVYNNDPQDYQRTTVRKRYQYKIYSSTGQFITCWTDVINDPSFRTVINGGAVELAVRLARKTLSFGEESDVAFGNEVQIWCFDQDAPTGVKVFSGYISRYDPRNDGPIEYIEVFVLGWHTRMAQFVLEDSVGTTGLTYSSKDPGEIAEDVINKGRVTGLPINWTETTLQKTGTVASYTFQANSIQEAVDKILELSPVGWYWYVDTDKNLNLHPKVDHAIHTFTIGKEVFYMEPQKRIENVINRIYFIGGIPDGSTDALYGRYERATSINNFGLFAIKKTDERVTLQATMDTICERILDAQELPEIRTVIRVKDNEFDRDNGYDIESIKVGDTCQIRNYQDAFANSKWDIMSWDIDYWDFNVRNLTEIVMQIVEIQYTPNWVELTISSKIPNVSKRIEDINRNLVESIAVSAPDNPVLGNV